VNLTPEQIASFKREGYLLIPSVFSAAELQAMREAMPGVTAEEGPHRVMEKDGVTVRSVYGSHKKSPVFDRVARNPTMVRAARALLGSDVYVYQFKINVKEAFTGDIWAWHQDFIYWEREDGLPRPDILNFAIFLDEVTEFNGPTLVIPKSHNLGVIDAGGPNIPVTQDRRLPYQGQPEWIENLVAKLKFTVDNPTVKELVDRWGLASGKGPAGSVLVFHSKIVHGSAPNISPYPRRLVMATYSRTDNVPGGREKRRPDFLCATDHSPLKAADEM
jgi:hypothetical protein